jgi:predicted ATPase
MASEQTESLVQCACLNKEWRKMYLQSVRLQNVKCFVDVELKFQTYRTGDPQSNWNVILGNNGDGKTSLLQAIAACLVDSTTAERLVKPDNWVRKGNGNGLAHISARIARDDSDKLGPGRRPEEEPIDRQVDYLIVDANQEISLEPEFTPSFDMPNHKYFSSAAIIEPSPEYARLFENPERVIVDIEYLKRNAFVARKQSGWISCGYGAYRRISGFASHTVNIDNLLQKRFLTLFEEGAALYDCEAWLKELDRKATKSHKETKSRQPSIPRKLLEEVKTTLCELLPEIDEIEIADEVRFRWRGSQVDLNQLSDGYRSMFALAVDLLRWVEMLRPSGVSIKDASGIVLIDEIDSHLHPRWQREAGFLLTRIFPHIQFIVTTHSPFVAMAAGPNALTLLKKDEATVTANQEVPYIRGWAVDRVLTELFAMTSIRDPETEGKIQRYEQLRFARRAGRLNDEDRIELTTLETDLNARLQDDPESPHNTQMNEDLQFFAQALREQRTGNH